MDKNDDLPVQTTSLKAGITAAVMMVAVCFTIAIMVSGNASYAASPELPGAAGQP